MLSGTTGSSRLRYWFLFLETFFQSDEDLIEVRRCRNVMVMKVASAIAVDVYMQAV